MEVESLNAWSTWASIHAFFVPMSLGRVQNAMSKGAVGEDQIAIDPESWPRLSQKDVRVFLGDVEMPIVTFTELKELVEIKGKKGSRWTYIVSVARTGSDGARIETAGKVLRVEIQAVVKQGDAERTERGEGFYLGFLRSK